MATITPAIRTQFREEDAALRLATAVRHTPRIRMMRANTMSQVRPMVTVDRAVSRTSEFVLDRNPSR